MYFFVHVFACMYIHHIFVCNMQICKYTYTYLYMHTSTWKMTDNKNCLWLHLNGWFTHLTIDCVSMAYSPELVFTKSSQNKRWGNLKKKKKKKPNPVKRSMLPPTSSAVLQPAGGCRRTDSSEALHMPVHKNMYQLLSVVNTAGGCSPSPKPIDSVLHAEQNQKKYFYLRCHTHFAKPGGRSRTRAGSSSSPQECGSMDKVGVTEEFTALCQSSLMLLWRSSSCC